MRSGRYVEERGPPGPGKGEEGSVGLPASGYHRPLGSTVRWAALVALAVLAVLALRRLDMRELARVLGRADAGLLLMAAGANLLALAMQAGRWLAVVRPVAPARPRDAFLALVAGYAVGLVVPARASDLARAHLMARRTRASMAALVTTTVVDHLVASIAMFAFFGLVAAFMPLPSWLRSAGLGALALSAAGLAALWIVHPRGEGVSRGKEGFLGRLRRGLVAVGRPRSLALSWACATGGWLGQCLIAWFSLRAFGLPATPAASLVVVLASALSSAASLSPGNAGTFEAACVLALASVGVGREPALAFSLGYHAVQLVPVALVGGGWLVAQGQGAGLTVLRSNR